MNIGRITSDPHRYILQRRLAKPRAIKGWQSISNHGRLEPAVAECCEGARRRSDDLSSAELLAEDRLRLVRDCAAPRAVLSPHLSSLREVPRR